jgi:hypothetical protein
MLSAANANYSGSTMYIHVSQPYIPCRYRRQIISDEESLWRFHYVREQTSQLHMCGSKPLNFTCVGANLSTSHVLDLVTSHRYYQRRIITLAALLYALANLSTLHVLDLVVSYRYYQRRSRTAAVQSCFLNQFTTTHILI